MSMFCQQFAFLVGHGAAADPTRSELFTLFWNSRHYEFLIKLGNARFTEAWLIGGNAEATATATAEPEAGIRIRLYRGALKAQITVADVHAAAAFDNRTKLRWKLDHRTAVLLYNLAATAA